MNPKTFFAILSTVIGLVAFAPYIRGILNSKTKPHEFTWLIMSITQGTAAAIMWQQGGGKGSIYLTVGAIFTFIVFIMSLVDGARNITRSDIVVLCSALLGIAIWHFLKNPLLAIIALSVVDVSSYIPTFRKSYSHPWTEEPKLWAAFAIANTFSILALEKYNPETLIYIVSITLANFALTAFLLVRRKKLL